MIAFNVKRSPPRSKNGAASCKVMEEWGTKADIAYSSLGVIRGGKKIYEVGRSGCI
jgi:hypothetical protein